MNHIAGARRLTSIELFTTDDGGTSLDGRPRVSKTSDSWCILQIHNFLFFHGEEFNIAGYRSRGFGGEQQRSPPKRAEAGIWFFSWDVCRA